ncbi:hypothetical protein ACTL6P_21990 [Endozoicomonas acroporae]|uniref:hypothetical protein n=1 Tax=Endozoicomonas acroporae TaxID=1701104 RepID=UPI000C76ED6C|nr:hypothetical protein [Endozoicomonas acroporae]
MNPLAPDTLVLAQTTSREHIQTPGQATDNGKLEFYYDASWLGFEAEKCLEELQAKVATTQLHAAIINYELFQNVLLNKYDLSDCAVDDRSKKFIINLMIADLINVRMANGRTGIKASYDRNQSVGDCIKSLEKLVTEGWDDESAKNLASNLAFERRDLAITMPEGYVNHRGMTIKVGTKKLSSFRCRARDAYIRENSALFAHDGAAEKIISALAKFGQQIANAYAPGLFPMQPQKFNLANQKTIIEIEANRMLPGDEYALCAERDRLQQSMFRALKQMTSPDSGLVNMILTSPWAAGFLAEPQKEILRKSLTKEDKNLPIPCYQACLLYYLIKRDSHFRRGMIQAGIDPKALESTAKGCMNIHNLAKARQGIDGATGQLPTEIEISSDALYEAHMQSLSDVNWLAAFVYSTEARNIRHFLQNKFTFLPWTDFLCILNLPDYLEALGIKPEYANPLAR